MSLKKSPKKIITYLAVIGLLIFLYNLGFLKPLEGFLSKGVNPILSEMHKLGVNIKSRFGEQVDKATLLKENEDLKREAIALVEENARYKILEEENRLLRESLGFLKRNKLKYLMANVISQGEVGNLSGRTDTIFIDKGEKDGVKKNFGVVGSDGLILGKIVEVKDSSSMVYLNNNSRCKLAAAILDKNGTSGITEGELGLTIKMSFIPQSHEIKIGDIVVTSGLEEFIPRGLVVGRVRGVTKENNDLWQVAEIESMSKTNNLVIVSVILP